MGPDGISDDGSCNQCAPTIVQRKMQFCSETYSCLHPNALNGNVSSKVCTALLLSPSSHLQSRRREALPTRCSHLQPYEGKALLTCSSHLQPPGVNGAQLTYNMQHQPPVAWREGASARSKPPGGKSQLICSSCPSCLGDRYGSAAAPLFPATCRAGLAHFLPPPPTTRKKHTAQLQPPSLPAPAPFWARHFLALPRLEPLIL